MSFAAALRFISSVFQLVLLFFGGEFFFVVWSFSWGVPSSFAFMSCRAPLAAGAMTAQVASSDYINMDASFEVQTIQPRPGLAAVGFSPAMRSLRVFDITGRKVTNMHGAAAGMLLYGHYSNSHIQGSSKPRILLKATQKVSCRNHSLTAILVPRTMK
jgi:hypothetical protein